MAGIHPSAIVAAGAEIGAEVEIGPFCTVGPHVVLGAGTRLISHAVVDGWTWLGEGCTVFPFASVGLQTQDLKFKGGAPRTEIGAHTTIREAVTIHAATFDGDATRVGSHCHIMAYAHIAHDCVVGDRVIMANAATLAGHVIVEDRAILGGLAAVHQFVRVGRLSITGGCTKVTQDVPPYMMADGNPVKVPTINSVGLKRAEVSEASQRALKLAHRFLYRQDLLTGKAVEAIERELEQTPEIRHLLEFIRASERGIIK